MSATPTFVQHMHTGSNTGSQTGKLFFLSLPDVVPAGDFVVLAITYNFNASRTVTITDLASPGGPGAANLSSQNTWTLADTKTDASNATTIAIYYTQGGSVVGTQCIKIAFDALLFNFQAVVSVFYNVDTSAGVVDVSGGRADITPTSGVVTSGSITTTVDGDLIYNYGIDANAGFPGNTLAVPTGYTPGTNFSLLSANRAANSLISWAQYLVQTSHGTVNPSVTLAGSMGADNDFMSLSVAFKASASTQGADFAAGIHIRHLFTLNDGVSSPQTINFPSSGNLIVLSHSAATSQDNVTGVTCSTSSVFTKHSDDANSSAEVFSTDAGATTGNDLTLTITWAGTPNGASSIVYDISGADNSPFDKLVGNNTTVTKACSTTQSRVNTDTTVTVGANSISNGDFLMWSGTANFEIIQVTAGGGTGTLTIARGQWGSTAGTHASATNLIEVNRSGLPNITPANANGLVIFTAALSTGPSCACSPGSFDHMFYLGETDAGGNNSADFYAHYYNPDTSAISNTIVLNNGAGLTGINYIGVAYKAAAVASGDTQVLTGNWRIQ